MVISIIAILTSIVGVSVGNTKKQSRDSKRIADVKTIQVALATYYANNLFYPTNIYASSTPVGSVATPLHGLAPAFIAVVPRDPNGNTTDLCHTTAANNTALPSCYRYSAYSSVNSICTTNYPVLYHLGAAFEDSANSNLTQDIDANQTLSNVYFGATYSACATAPSNFHGNATGCNGTSGAGTDSCYDLTP